jgi:hypothetical protein
MNNNHFPSLLELALDFFTQHFHLISELVIFVSLLYCVQMKFKNFVSSELQRFIGQTLPPSLLSAFFTRLKEKNLVDDKIIRLIFHPIVNFASDSFVNTLPLNSLDLSDIPFLSDKSISQYDEKCNLSSNSSQ